jgi:hypothetical protein
VRHECARRVHHRACAGHGGARRSAAQRQAGQLCPAPACRGPQQEVHISSVRHPVSGCESDAGYCLWFRHCDRFVSPHWDGHRLLQSMKHARSSGVAPAAGGAAAAEAEGGGGGGGRRGQARRAGGRVPRRRGPGAAEFLTSVKGPSSLTPIDSLSLAPLMLAVMFPQFLAGSATDAQRIRRGSRLTAGSWAGVERGAGGQGQGVAARGAGAQPPGGDARAGVATVSQACCLLGHTLCMHYSSKTWVQAL